jgi:hypothetical protein
MISRNLPANAPAVQLGRKPMFETTIAGSLPKAGLAGRA